MAGVSLIPTATKYQARWNQVDVSAKKTVKIGRRSFEGQVAVFNVLNNNVVLSENEQFGATLGQARNILQARLLRLALLLDF